MNKIVINAETIIASGVFTSKPVLVPCNCSNFGLQWVITDDGTGKFEVETSGNGGSTFIEDTTDIATAQTKTTGPDGAGNNSTVFSPVPCEAVRIKCTETGTADSIVVTAILTIT